MLSLPAYCIQARRDHFSTKGGEVKVKNHGPPILIEGPRNVAELTTGHVYLCYAVCEFRHVVSDVLKLDRCHYFDACPT